ncbi:pol protein [Cucumis melo var. makuwa]|uniref:Pol protein n=1 Tax=Cucumis melo var. makuwa TaxID=1194695 RepID=A0A5D3DVA9_CUCMM|nr:pol protein [Cucumis melo var. makuwa]
MYERCLCVPTDSAVKTELLTEAHSSPFSMHPGSTKMYQDLKRVFWWRNMKRSDRLRLPRTLKGYTVIWVVVDRLTKLLTLFHGNPLTLPLALDTRLDFSTAFHPQIDGQIERLNQILEDMLRACVLEFSGSCDSHLHLMEFTYNNSYQTTIGMTPFEALYGRCCRSPVCWGEVGSTYEGCSEIREKGEASPRFVGPFEILEWIGLVAYRLALPPAFSAVHDVFYFSMLRKEVKMLRNRGIALVKVLSQNHGAAEAIWEREDDMRAQYPKLCED